MKRAKGIPQSPPYSVARAQQSRPAASLTRRPEDGIQLPVVRRVPEPPLGAHVDLAEVLELPRGHGQCRGRRADVHVLEGRCGWRATPDETSISLREESSATRG